jgi:hypothetical protein
VTSFTAATLNSRVNVRRDFAISDLLDKSLHPYLAVHQSWGTSEPINDAKFFPFAMSQDWYLNSTHLDVGYKTVKELAVFRRIAVADVLRRMQELG